MAEQWFLRELRKELRLNQTDVEKDAGLMPPRISDLERGVGNAPTPEERQKIVKALVRRAAVRGLEILILGQN
jgi:transcriptional regulator with XRE-family HTH domain